jgi:thiol-disulfide isomerase/thioredoxin
MERLFRATRPAALLLTLTLIAAAQAQAPGQAATDFTLVDKSGAVVRLSDFAGTPIVLNAWATWCAFCIEEIPLFQQAHDDINASSEQVVFLLVNLAENFDQARDFIDNEVGTTLRTAYDPTAAIRADHDGVEFDTTRNLLTRTYRVRGMPTTFFIDAEGVIQSLRIGPLSEGELAEHLAGVGVEWQR